uniref:Uncharacterized protein n=1 Tax=Rhizophora mucronata TaxID=61149 RepID=A0A2P2J489_RHIMU
MLMSTKIKIQNDLLWLIAVRIVTI